MAKEVKKLQADVVIAGAGPGGLTVARELSKAGKKVIVLEKGGYLKRFIGSPLAMLGVLEKPGKYFTEQGDNVLLAKGVGGGTIIYAGTCHDPLHDLWQKYGIDITQEAKEAKKEMGAQVLPDSLISPGVRRLMTAARELGYPWEKTEKFIDPDKCKLGCMKCAFGCPKGAKWTAEVYAREAIQNGAEVLTHVMVNNVIVEDGTAVGMIARGNDGQDYDIRAKTIICAAGGFGTAIILRKSGIYQAGMSFLGDPAILTAGYVKDGPVQNDEVCMSIGWHDNEDGIMYCNLNNPKSVQIALLFSAPGKLHRVKNILRFGKTMCVMAKMTDDVEGQVHLDGRISKPYTKRDIFRMEKGVAVSQQILIQAGCDPYSLECYETNLGHPASTVRVGNLLDSNLQTSIKNLYCCDSSVIPEGLGIPPTLTIVALGKRLAKHLQTVLGGAQQRVTVR